MSDILILARWLLPIEPEVRCLENTGMLIRDGRIIVVDQNDALLSNYPDAQAIHYGQHLVMPGLVNAHCHAAMSLLRGIAEDQLLHDWLEKTIWPLERALVSPEFVRDGVQLACAEMLRGGITCFADHYFYAEHSAPVIDDMGMRAVLAVPVLDFPMPGVQNGFEAIDKAVQLRDDLRSRHRLQVAFGPHAPYSVEDALLERIATLANETGMGIHMHVHESAQEIYDSVQRYGVRPLQRLHNMGLLSPQFLAVHATQLNDNDFTLLSQNGVHVAHCPESNMKLANGFCPLEKLHSLAINTALGTDGAASNNDLDLLSELRTATLLAKAVAQSPRAARAETMAEMITLGGAKALGLDHEIGSLLPGKSADFIAIDFSSLEMHPVHNPLAQLIYNSSRHCVQDVWVEGRRLVKSQHLLSADSDEIVARTQHWQNTIQEIIRS